MYFFDWAVITLFVLSLLSIIWGPKDISTILFGLRFNFELFALYFAVRMLKLDLSQIKRALYVVIGASLVVILFGILQSTILPWDFLNNLGYTYAYEWLPGENAQSSQVVEGTRDLSRILSTLSGPNQLGSYLLVIGGIFLSAVIFLRSFLLRILGALAFVALLLPLYRSYCRSAWLGLLVTVIALLAFIIYSVVRKKKQKRPTGLLAKTLIIAILVVVIVVGLVYFNPVSKELLVQALERPTSTYYHLEAYRGAIEFIKESPLGKGIGIAGPASQWALGVDRAIITESSYLQIGVELGILGMILFLVAIIGLLWKLFSQAAHPSEPIKKLVALACALGLVAVAASSLFLHTFTDSATTFTLFALIGMVIGAESESKELKFEK